MLPDMTLIRRVPPPLKKRPVRNPDNEALPVAYANYRVATEPYYKAVTCDHMHFLAPIQSIHAHVCL